MLKAIADAGLALDDIDGRITSAETRASKNLGASPYFARPTTRRRLTGFSRVDPARVGVKNVSISNPMRPTSARWMGLALRPSVMVYARPPWFGTRGPTSQAVRAQQSPNINQGGPGQSAFTRPWGLIRAARCHNLVIFQQYCKKIRHVHDGLAPLCLNLRRNGLMTPGG